MDNFYNTNDNFPPQTPPYYEQPQHYEGSSSCASAALILGILSLLSICCMPPLALVFAGLSFILGALSKGEKTRPQNARVGMILSGVSLAGVLILLAVVLIRFTSDSTNTEFLKQYLNIIEHPDNYSEDDIYDFLYDYLYPNDGSNDGSDFNNNYNDSQPYYYDDTPNDSNGSDGYDYYYQYPVPDEGESGNHNVI